MAQISMQVVLNIAVVTNSMPNTGVSLPFISYGGTSLVFLMAEMGLVFSVSKSVRKSDNIKNVLSKEKLYEKKKEEKTEKKC